MRIKRGAARESSARERSIEKKERPWLVQVQTSASPSATTKPVRARFHERAPFRYQRYSNYSDCNYSLYRSSIAVRMQQKSNRRFAPISSEARFGQVLREVRKSRGLTQEELAFRAGYSNTYIGLLERGKKSPSLRTIVSLATVLETPGSELLRRIEALDTSPAPALRPAKSHSARKKLDPK